jgi:DNA-binding HxlR family transcriptional regulator
MGSKQVQFLNWPQLPKSVPMATMKSGYGQFCPVAKASEIFAARWTPLVLRELMSGVHTFNDIHRGVPLMSRALLIERLRQLEEHGIVEKRTSANGSGHEYWLTESGDAAREIVHALGHWGLFHARDRITKDDLDPGLLMWVMRKRTDIKALPEHRVVIRFEFSGVPASRTKLRIMWLILERSGVDVCAKDPGFPVDLTLQGDIRAFVAIFLRQASWQELMGKALSVEGDAWMAQRLPTWIQLDKIPGRPQPPTHPAA